MLLAFSWIENGSVSNASVWTSNSVVDEILSKDGTELKTWIMHSNILPNAHIKNVTNIAVHRVGSIQEIFPNVEFINC